MHSYDIVGYTADCDVWCVYCFTEAGYKDPGIDGEGNECHPIFAGEENVEEEVCCICHQPLIED
jgi:hypothetical protein